MAWCKINEKALKSISSRPKYKEGSTWSEQLLDKEEPVATHMHWALRNCEQNPQKLQSQLSNTVNHYKNEHSNCHPTSRCKIDPNYEPSCVVITNPKAETLLQMTIEKSVMYKSPQDYVLARDTSYVVSFNNMMNIFQDKRISFSDMQYNMRSQLAVIHWNENVNREYTSVWKPRTAKAPRRQKGKKKLQSAKILISSKYLGQVYYFYVQSTAPLICSSNIFGETY